MLPHNRKRQRSEHKHSTWAEARSWMLSETHICTAFWCHSRTVSEKEKTTACYTVWPLQSWSKESQITGRKLKTITPISTFVLWKLKSRVASLCKGCDTSPVRTSSRDWALLADSRRKDTLLVFPIYLCFFAQGSIGVPACNTSIWLACHLAVWIILGQISDFQMQKGSTEHKKSVGFVWFCVLVTMAFW